MTDAELRAAIFAYVEEHDFVTFAAIHKEFAGDARESTEISLPGNRIIWLGLPKPVIDAVTGMIAEGILAAIPGHIAAYRRPYCCGRWRRPRRMRPRTRSARRSRRRPRPAPTRRSWPDRGPSR
jgi:hypothetical protein